MPSLFVVLRRGWPRASLLLGLLAGTGCGRLGYEALVAAGDGGVPPVSGDAGGAGDAVVGADGPFAGEGGLSGPDAGRDGPLTGSGARLCTPSIPDGVALWDFESLEGGVAVDSIGAHHGTYRGEVSQVDGPRGPCGRGLFFAGNDAHVSVPDHPDWQLDEGSVDLWVKPGAGGRARGILSRDAVGTKEPGHFVMMLLPDNRLVLRMQHSDAPTIRVFLCSDAPLVADRWTHIGVNFGPPMARMFVDGAAVTAVDEVSGNGVALAVTQCGITSAQGIAGNNEPWLVGASAHRNDDRDADYPAIGVAVDHVRIARSRRDFAAIFAE